MESKDIFKKFVEFLDGRNIVYNKNEPSTYFWFEINFDIFKFDANIICGEGYFAIAVQMPLSIKSDKISSVLEQINDFNCKSPSGNFEYRIHDSGLYAKVGRLVSSDELNIKDLEADFDRALNIASRNVRLFLEILDKD